MPKKSESEKEEKKVKIEKKKITQEEFEKKVVELAKKGLTSEKIGEELYNQGIHPKEYNKKISKILKGEKIYTNPDLRNVEIKLARIKKHQETNKQDKNAMREKDRVFSQLKRLKTYFKVPIK